MADNKNTKYERMTNKKTYKIQNMTNNKDSG